MASIVPPGQRPVGSPVAHVLPVVGGTVVFAAIPLLIYLFRRSSWRHEHEQGPVGDTA
ncbi:hypothetical protein [Streptomyces pacificus]|uniref:hypothetical protein n=1 Tax=Streptomyces pacificus TaxID=2705029 RepID=UPI001563FB57|nr:hypothetical protein [Streptomyces pacificus]